MKSGSVETSPINNSISTIGTQGDGQKPSKRLSLRMQSSHTVLTELNN